MIGICLGLLFDPAYPIEDSLSLAHGVIECAGEFNGGILQPEFDKDKYLCETTRDDAYERKYLHISMRHTSLGHGLPWTLAVSQAYDQERNIAMIFCDADILPMNRLGNSEAWAFMLEAIPKIVLRISPCFALVNGTGKLGITFKNNGSLGVPHIITPWTYFGPKVLKGALKNNVETLPDCRIENLGEGLVLRPVKDFFSRPSQRFLSALAALDVRPPFKYRQSNPPREDRKI